jgi:YhcH/YjgK/YiaL family protein
MILDSFPQWRRYAPLSPRFQKAFNFLDQLNDDAEVGRKEIDGDDVYALVQRYTTKPLQEGKFEAHRKYIDVQYLLAGTESIIWAPLPSLQNVLMPYDESGDAVLFGLVPGAPHIDLNVGQFAILFPADGHIPGRICGAPCEVLKVVVKVRVDIHL